MSAGTASVYCQDSNCGVIQSNAIPVILDELEIEALHDQYLFEWPADTPWLKYYPFDYVYVPPKNMYTTEDYYRDLLLEEAQAKEQSVDTSETGVSRKRRPEDDEADVDEHAVQSKKVKVEEQEPWTDDEADESETETIYLDSDEDEDDESDYDDVIVL
ncbi:hypothetical protein QR680_015317 [Steinernema hermaphroditum]|uniref:Uncharacterized protein n=1 Tax=Steinernema hermaphroditum TaxID=289476 RepID=A0AA39LKD6_9BILA|nr:hypothetical protein QR680_015317 [Steinernema hermaphroditum]